MKLFVGFWILSVVHALWASATEFRLSDPEGKVTVRWTEDRQTEGYKYALEEISDRGVKEIRFSEDLNPRESMGLATFNYSPLRWIGTRALVSEFRDCGDLHGGLRVIDIADAQLVLNNQFLTLSKAPDSTGAEEVWSFIRVRFFPKHGPEPTEYDDELGQLDFLPDPVGERALRPRVRWKPIKGWVVSPIVYSGSGRSFAIAVQYRNSISFVLYDHSSLEQLQKIQISPKIAHPVALSEATITTELVQRLKRFADASRFSDKSRAKYVNPK